MDKMAIGFLKKVVKLAQLVRNASYRRGLRKGVAAAIEHERLLKTLSVNTIIDIGANRGQFALVARHCFPKAKIISFEPLVDPAKKFWGVFAGDQQMTLHITAIGPKCDSAVMHVSERDDSSSLLSITTLQNSLFPGTSEQRRETVQVAPLGTLIAPNEIIAPALLKLDVQGFELQALESCVELLPLFTYVYVECSFVELYAGQALADEVIAFLQGVDFRLEGVYNMLYNAQGRAVQADFLFVYRKIREKLSSVDRSFER
jgi:FkbM family methyltransferase